MQVDFYQLTTTPLERVLPQIAEKVLAGGGRLLVVTADAARRAALDRALWTYSPESFLPHGEAGGELDADQPVLLSAEVVPANGARLVAIVDGQWREEALGFERALHFFDGDSVDAAREAWKALKDRDGIERRYWKQDERGRWQQAA